MAYSVFPERLDKLNVEDVPGSLGALEQYINYMQERVEFSLTNMYKTVQGAGVSSAEMLVLIAALSNSLSAVTATVNQVQGTVTGLQTTVGNHTAQLEADQQALASLRTDVDAAAAKANLNAAAITALQGQMATMAQDISGMTQDISDLDRRVTALEGGG